MLLLGSILNKNTYRNATFKPEPAAKYFSICVRFSIFGFQEGDSECKKILQFAGGKYKRQRREPQCEEKY